MAMDKAYIEKGIIIKVAGPLVVAKGLKKSKMYDVVKVSKHELIGEIIECKGDLSSIQVYEETGGIGPGEEVFSTGEPLSVELGPGLLTSIYDGIQRPLDILKEETGNFIARGVDIPKLSRKKKWHFKPTVKKGDKVSQNDFVGMVQETEALEHRIMVPPNTPDGEIVEIGEGEFSIDQIICKLKTKDGIVELTMLQRWPVRIGRPIKERLAPDEPLTTGQRVIDAFFPIAKGGTACVPGPFGSGKTVIQHQLAKWVDAEVIVYIGCGERGNEMADVLIELPELIDPRSGKPLMERTVLIANTSNMPVAAREASVFTGITIAEYFRDMGYSVALMADSTSRWAEAMREISGRLEEMPGEEGYPAYLGTKIASFYERAGKVKCVCSGERKGSLSVIGAISPPGGDLSDPVVQATLRIVKVFWSLEYSLAYQRHFPAISWLNSYSLYHDNIHEYLVNEIGEEWLEMKSEAMRILQEEAELMDIVKLVGMESISKEDKLTLDTSRAIREDFLHQNAFHEVDTFTSFKKMFKMLKLILDFHNLAKEVIKGDVQVEELSKLPVREKMIRSKYLREDNLSEFDEMEKQIQSVLNSLISKQVSETQKT